MKSHETSTLAAATLAAMLVFTLSPISGAPGQDKDQKDDSESKIQQGFAIAPVPLDLRGKNRALVGKGSYIVNAQGDCNACHSSFAPDYVPGAIPSSASRSRLTRPATSLEAGNLDQGVAQKSQPYAGPCDGLPAGYTFEEFLHVMRTGEDLKQFPRRTFVDIDLLQAPMPWPLFQKMTDRDILAIYEYLRSVPSRTPGTGFPQ